MEQKNSIAEILELMSLPGFCVTENRITLANQAAGAMFLTPGLDILPLLHTGAEEYAQFQGGQLCLTLCIADKLHNATVIRMDDTDLFLLDDDSQTEEFRSMALVSMELRTPLMQVMQNAEQLFSTMDSQDPAAAKMNKGLLQLMRTVCNLSDVSRYLESSFMETRDICTFLEEILEKARTLTAGTGICLSWDLPREAIPCLIDSEQLERAVWNLISNAVKFTPKGGTVHAQLTCHNKRLQFRITDSGSGIAESVRSSVFQRYLRQPGIEDNRFGLGLGMVIVRTCAANHGGTVLIDRSGDSGTRITMTLSLRQNADTTVCSPILRPDYSSGWDHGLLELSDCLPAEEYTNFL